MKAISGAFVYYRVRLQSAFKLSIYFSWRQNREHTTLQTKAIHKKVILNINTDHVAYLLNCKNATFIRCYLFGGVCVNVWRMYRLLINISSLINTYACSKLILNSRFFVIPFTLIPFYRNALHDRVFAWSAMFTKESVVLKIHTIFLQLFSFVLFAIKLNG